VEKEVHGRDGKFQISILKAQIQRVGEDIVGSIGSIGATV
jgi:hypothetical protein